MKAYWFNNLSDNETPIVEETTINDGTNLQKRPSKHYSIAERKFLSFQNYLIKLVLYI